MTLRTRLFLGISVIFFLTGISIFSVSFRETSRFLETQLASHAQEAADALARVLPEALEQKDLILAETQIATIFDRGHFLSIEVYSPDGARLLRRALPVRIEGVPEWFAALVAITPPPGEAFLSSGWKQIGKVVVVSQPTFAYRYLWDNSKSFLWWLTGIYVLSLLATRLFIRVIMDPIIRIEDAAKAISQRRFVQITKIPRTRELKNVVSAMNTLSQKVSEMLDQLEAKAEQYRIEAFRDPVTGLDNRKMFEIRFHQLDEEGVLSGSRFALLQIEGLDAYNRSQGFEKGNDLLRAMAGKVSAHFPNALLATRLSGQAFAFILPHDGDDPSSVLENVVKDLKIVLLQYEALSAVSFHIGITRIAPNEPMGKILSRGDLAVEIARQKGKNTWAAVEEDRSGVVSAGAANWRRMILDAITHRKILLDAQPVIHLTTRAPVHLEVMGRLLDFDGTPLPPILFLPMANRHEMLPEVDRLVISQLIDRLEKYGNSPVLAANLSLQSVGNDAFRDWLDQQLTQNRKAASRLAFEVSELTCALGEAAVADFRSMIRECGGQFGIDRFGMDVRASERLRLLVPDYVKLDGTLLQNAAHPDNDTDNQLQMVKAIAQLAHSLNIAVIAQNVEDEAVMQRLVELGFDGAQGFLFGKPERL